MDPNLLDGLNKRKRASLDADVAIAKPPRYHLKTVSSAASRLPTTSITPRLDTAQKAAAPVSAPAAAGRSPTSSKRHGGLLGRKRFAPPAFGTPGSPSVSIAAALSGTLAQKKTKKGHTLQDRQPKSWFFDIYEESQEQQDYRINEWTMTQSATSLDISDDEARAQQALDRGKENIDPDEVSAPVTRSMAAAAAAAAAVKVERKDIMTDETRSPLGELDPKDYYGEGLDATSVVLVHDEAEAEPVDDTAALKTIDAPVNGSAAAPSTTTTATREFVVEAAISSSVPEPTRGEGDGSKTLASIGALLADVVPAWEESTSTRAHERTACTSASASEIEIWESESAKDEAEAEADAEDSETVLAVLQEL